MFTTPFRTTGFQEFSKPGFQEFSRPTDSQSSMLPHTYSNPGPVICERWDDIICYGDENSNSRPERQSQVEYDEEVLNRNNSVSPNRKKVAPKTDRLMIARKVLSQGRAITAGAQRKGQKVRLFRNGDPYFKGTIFVVSADR